MAEKTLGKFGTNVPLSRENIGSRKLPQWVLLKNKKSNKKQKHFHKEIQ
jgi:hypothetical protein